MNIENLYTHFSNSSGVCTDTRIIFNNCLFFALKGDNFNGNHFADEALDKGALKVIIDEPEYHRKDGKTILVKNVLIALQQLASFHRLNLKTELIALTGSNGKTTTKELINAVLSAKLKTVATKGNLNNHIGVPLTLLSITSETEIAIIEMGANHPKEIEILCDIAQPDYGYITNFGKAHLEGFINLEGVVKAKTELYQHLKNNDKTVFINENDPIQVEKSKGLKKSTFGNAKSDCNVEIIDLSSYLKVKYENLEIKSNLVGKYNFPNIAAAIAIGKYFEVAPDKIKSAIEGYVPTNNRSQLLVKNSNTILLDAYNANPSSMMAAVENFQQAKGDNKILFLGDMFEVGPDAAIEHQNIVDYLSQNTFGQVNLIGKNFFQTKTDAPHIKKFETFEDLKSQLKENPPKNRSLLIKASRGMALERILEFI